MTHRDLSVQHWGGTIAYLIWMFLSHKTVRCLVLKHKRKMLIRYKIRLKLICMHTNLVLFTIPQENSFRMTQNGNKPALVRIMTWRRKYDMPLSELIKANIFFFRRIYVSCGLDVVVTLQNICYEWKCIATNRSIDFPRVVRIPDGHLKVARWHTRYVRLKS